MDDTLKVLKKSLKKSKKVNDGTVVRFVALEKYTYAAVYVAGFWWITGNSGMFNGVRKFTYNEFMNDVLSDCTNIEVAVNWGMVS